MRLLIFTLLFSVVFPVYCFKREAQKNYRSSWKIHNVIMKQLQKPVFQNKVYNVADFGALSDTAFDSRPAFLAAIKLCNANGGGKIIIPRGTYLLNGPLVLLSNVHLVLENATIYFGTNPVFYTPLVLVRWEGTLCYNYSPLIYARRQKNIAISGKGTFDGCEHKYWYRWNDPAVNWIQRLQIPERKVLRQMGNDTIAVHKRVFGNGFLDLNGDGKDDGYGDGKQHYLRPSLFEPFECDNILVEGVTFRNSPFWTLHPVFCNNVIFKNLTVLNGSTNDDGIDPDGCSNVLIDNCFINTHDDAISIKAGRDQDAWKRKGTENIIIRNCVLRSTCNAFCIGSEMSGGVKNVWFYNSKIIFADQAINFKTNMDRGGFISDVFINNIEVDTTRLGIFFQMDYPGFRGNNYPTRMQDFYCNNIRMRIVKEKAIKIIGTKEQPVRRVWLSRIQTGNTFNKTETIFVSDFCYRNIK